MMDTYKREGNPERNFWERTRMKEAIRAMVKLEAGPEIATSRVPFLLLTLG